MIKQNAAFPSACYAQWEGGVFVFRRVDLFCDRPQARVPEGPFYFAWGCFRNFVLGGSAIGCRRLPDRKIVIPFRETRDKLWPILFPPRFAARFLIAIV